MRTAEQIMLELMDDQETDSQRGFMLGAIAGMLFATDRITSKTLMRISDMPLDCGRKLVAELMEKAHD